MPAKQRAVPAAQRLTQISMTRNNAGRNPTRFRPALCLINWLQILVLRTSSSLTSPSRSLHRRIMSCRKSSCMLLLIQLTIWP